MSDISNTSENATATTRICVVCGNPFNPSGTDDLCCSPICRTMRMTSVITSQRQKEDQKRKAELDAMKQPPRFNLKDHPKARAEWFMSLPDEYKPKFRRFLSPQELDIAKAIDQKRLAEERILSGFFVKKGKIVDVKGKGEDDADAPPDEPDTRNTEGTDDEGFYA